MSCFPDAYPLRLSCRCDFPLDIDHGVRALVNEWIVIFKGDRNSGAAFVGIERRGGKALRQFTFDRDEAPDLPGRQMGIQGPIPTCSYEGSNIHDEPIG